MFKKTKILKIFHFLKNKTKQNLCSPARNYPGHPILPAQGLTRSQFGDVKRQEMNLVIRTYRACVIYQNFCWGPYDKRTFQACPLIYCGGGLC